MSETTKKRRGNPNMVKGGPSVNPRGRPRSGLAFAERVRERVDPDTIIDAALDVLAHAEKPSERLQAAAFLRDSGYLKPPTTAALQVTDGRQGQSAFDWSKLPVETRRRLLADIEAAQNPNPEEN